MPNLVPGFRWEPVDVGNRAARRKGRGLIGHVAVSNSINLRPGPLTTRSSDWHFYLPKVGVGIQQIDLDVQCWASSAGNATMPAFESQGGMGTSAQLNAEPWTDDQCEAAAQILAHLNRTEGAPLQVMPDSLPGSRGFGTHRLGISPWRVAGGESWSSVNGKECPGNAKVGQVPAIVARAQQIVNGSPTATTGGFLMALSDAEQAELLARVRGITFAKPGATNYDVPFVPLDSMRLVGIADAMQQILSRGQVTAADVATSLAPTIAAALHDAGSDASADEIAAKVIAGLGQKLS